MKRNQSRKSKAKRLPWPRARPLTPAFEVCGAALGQSVTVLVP